MDIGLLSSKESESCSSSLKLSSKASAFCIEAIIAKRCEDDTEGNEREVEENKTLATINTEKAVLVKPEINSQRQ